MRMDPSITIQSIPQDILIIILESMAIEDVIMFLSTCSQFRRFGQESLLWKKIFRKRYSKEALKDEEGKFKEEILQFCKEVFDPLFLFIEKEGDEEEEDLYIDYDSVVKPCCYNGWEILLDKIMSKMKKEEITGDDFRELPMHSALIGGHQRIVDLMLAHGKRINEGRDTFWSRQNALEVIISSGGPISSIRLLLENGADPNAISERFPGQGMVWEKSPLRAALERGDKEIVKLLRQFGATVDHQDSTY